MPPYTEINRQKSSGKINDPVASGEAQAGRAVGAAGGCGKMNSIQTAQVKSQKSARNIQRTFKFLIVLSGVLTLCTVKLRVVFFLGRDLSTHLVHVQLEGFGHQIFKSMLRQSTRSVVQHDALAENHQRRD